MKQAEVARTLADRFNLSLPTAYRRLRERRLPLLPVKIGPSVRYRRKDVERMVRGLEAEAEAA